MRKFLLASVAIIIAIIVSYNAYISVLFPLKYEQHILEASKVNNISPAIIASIIRAESGFKPASVSKKGAIGLMQVMPETAQYITGLEDVDLFDPKININVGTKYFKYLLNKFEDVNTALFAYNAGEGNVTKWLNGAKTLKASPYRESNAYVDKVNTAIPFYSRAL